MAAVPVYWVGKIMQALRHASPGNFQIQISGLRKTSAPLL